MRQTSTVVQFSIQRMVCTECGAEANASCNCGKPYVPAKQRAKEEAEKDPSASVRTIAERAGTSVAVAHEAKAGVRERTPETVTGKDGKQYPARLKAKAEPKATTDEPFPYGDVVRPLEADQKVKDQESEVADPATIEDNALYTLERINEHARVFKKFFKLSTFDHEAEVRMHTAIDRMLQKWRSTQATLTSAELTAAELMDEPCDECDTAQQRWEMSLSNLAAVAATMRPYWNRQFGDWEKFEKTSRLAILAREAAEQWKKLADELETGSVA